jgi:hypothetical protein
LSGELCIRCGCGAQIEGRDEQTLLAAYDQHLATAHRAAVPGTDGAGSTATLNESTGLPPTDGASGL